jgi:hypothetical protein
VSLADLESLLARLADAVLSDPVLRGYLVMLELEEHHNTVRLTMSTSTPQEALDRVAEELGAPGLVVETTSATVGHDSTQG